MLTPDELQLRKLSKIALAAMTVLLAASIIFYQERVFMADSAFLLFNIVNNKSLSILNNRYGEAVGQLIPYLGQKMHLPLRAILIGYSASLNVLYVLITAVIIYPLRQSRLAILMSLYYFLVVSASFMVINDVALGVAYMFLQLAVTLYLANRKTSIILILIPFLLLGILAISAHFIIMFPFVFLWVYMIMEKKHWPFSTRDTIILSLALASLMLYKYLATVNGDVSYDNAQLTGIKKLSFSDIPDAFTRPVIRIFLVRCLTNYWLAAILLLAGLAHLIANRKILLPLWVAGSCAAYFAMMGVTFGTWPFNFQPEEINRPYQLWHTETEWSSIGILVAVPFIFSLLPRLKLWQSSTLLIALFAIRMAYMASYIPDYTWRTNFCEKTLTHMRKKGIYKAAIYREDSLSKRSILDWAYPYESALKSALDGDSTLYTFTFVNRDDKQTLDLLRNSNDFYNSWDMLPAWRLNSSYFHVSFAQPYQPMSYEELCR